MRDMDIREALRKRLEEEHQNEPDTLIVEELGLCQGVSRVDVALVNGSLNGYEIKSERDTLARLPQQIEIYNRTLDYITIVVNHRHLETVERMVPEWWGIDEATESESSVQVLVRRPPWENPCVDPDSVVQLLWRDEALSILHDLGLDKGLTSKPRPAIWAALARALPVPELKSIVRSVLKTRSHWRFDARRT